MYMMLVKATTNNPTFSTAHYLLPLPLLLTDSPPQQLQAHLPLVVPELELVQLQPLAPKKTQMPVKTCEHQVSLYVPEVLGAPCGTQFQI